LIRVNIAAVLRPDDRQYVKPAATYYLAMLSAGVAAAALAAIAGSTGGHLGLLPDLLVRIALLLGALNVAGAVAIFRPIGRFLAGERDARATAAARLASLPALSGLWVGGLAAAAMLAHSATVYGSWAAMLGAPGVLLGGTLLHIAGFAAYLGLFAYFLIVDYTVRLRERLWAAGEAFAARRGRLLRRLVAALVAVALAPVLVMLAEQARQPVPPMPMAMGMGMRHGEYMRQTLHMDLFAALLLAAVVIWLVARGFARPIDVLLGAMQRVDRGDLRVRAPVVSDDELGLLTERFNRMLNGLEERDRVRRIFARFVPESVAAALLAKDGAVASQEREASVLFADIESFTAIASRLAPREVVQMLNDYFAEVAHIIHGAGGVITQFQGDAVLACFNLPVNDSRHAQHALASALAVQARLAEASFVGGVKLRARIGIATGRVVGGTVGGDERLGYTVHGDTVNLAARLEEMNKTLGSRVLVCARTAELLGAAAPLRDRGKVAVRGFAERLQVFEPLAG
jgi:class 3 adenylate cyclase